MRNVHKEGHYVQTDERWASITWRVPKVANSLWTLAKRLNDWPKGHSGAGKRISLALDSFCRTVRTTTAKPPNINSDGTLGASGCFIVSMANALRVLNVPLNGRIATPDVLLQHLQISGYVSLVDSASGIGFDPLAILTRGKIQLAGIEDWGRRGVHPSKSPALCNLSRDEAAIAGVRGHGVYGKDQHYVLCTRRTGHDWEMEDPGRKAEATLLEHFPRIYAVWLYKKCDTKSRKNGRR